MAVPNASSFEDALYRFLDDREALRAFVDQFAAACRESLQIDVRASSNYLFVFQRQEGIGRRGTAMACGYCGAGGPAGIAPGTDWTCAACGRRNGGYRRGDATDERLDADMRALWDRHPHLRPATGLAAHRLLSPLVRVARRAKRLGTRTLNHLRGQG